MRDACDWLSSGISLNSGILVIFYQGNARGKQR
jgi:hypothetical protein